MVHPPTFRCWLELLDSKTVLQNPAPTRFLDSSIPRPNTRCLLQIAVWLEEINWYTNNAVGYDDVLTSKAARASRAERVAAVPLKVRMFQDALPGSETRANMMH